MCLFNIELCLVYLLAIPFNICELHTSVLNFAHLHMQILFDLLLLEIGKLTRFSTWYNTRHGVWAETARHVSKNVRAALI